MYFFKKKPRLTMTYDEKEDRIFFESSGDFTILMLAIALEELAAQNPEVFTIMEETYGVKHTLH